MPRTHQEFMLRGSSAPSGQSHQSHKLIINSAQCRVRIRNLSDAVLVVGLTGTFGSGKSTVGKLFGRCGARKVINCDQIVHEAFRPGHPLRKRIDALFDSEKRLSRKQIAKKVFSNQTKRKRLEALIHPYVRKRVLEEMSRIQKGVVVVEAPLLFESHFDRLCDVTITVSAGRRNIIRRLARKGFKPDEVCARMNAQLSELVKRRKADLVILNFGSKELLVVKVKKVWTTLLSKHKQMMDKELRQ